MANPQLGVWTTDLCGCFEDIGSCCCAYWCPCIPVGEIVNVVDKGQTTCCEGGLIFFLLQFTVGLGFLYTCFYRKKMREMYNLPPNPCNDVLTDCFCLCCSISQTYRELKNRGLNPSKGVKKTAPPEQFMQRA